MRLCLNKKLWLSLCTCLFPSLLSFSVFISLFLSLHKVKVGSLNVIGGRNNLKRAILTDIFNKKNIMDGLFLLKTHSFRWEVVSVGGVRTFCIWYHSLCWCPFLPNLNLIVVSVLKWPQGGI